MDVEEGSGVSERPSGQVALRDGASSPSGDPNFVSLGQRGRSKVGRDRVDGYEEGWIRFVAGGFDVSSHGRSGGHVRTGRTSAELAYTPPRERGVRTGDSQLRV